MRWSPNKLFFSNPHKLFHPRWHKPQEVADALNAWPGWNVRRRVTCTHFASFRDCGVQSDGDILEYATMEFMRSPLLSQLIRTTYDLPI